MTSPKFSESSTKKIATLHWDLQTILGIAINKIDFTVIDGYRDATKQEVYFKQGVSTKQFPNSKHNEKPSKAVDLAPYPIDWENRERFVHLAGIIQGVALAKDIKIRWGGDWDSDNDLHDQNLYDLGHFEKVDE